jgi:16S rRNA (cytosine1402-N4)-methyltransferase
MTAEVLELLAPRNGGLAVDCTLGLGGHAEAVLRYPGFDGRLLGLDRDAEVLELARVRLARFGERFTAVPARFSRLDQVLARVGWGRPSSVLFDLGASSLHFDRPERGFSFRQDGPLDMRMDRGSGPTAADLVNGLDAEALAEILWTCGEEPKSRRIARAIVGARQRAAITTTAQLAGLVRRAVGGRYGRIDPATRTFQALRITVNDELNELEKGLQAAAASAAPGARLAVISFHSLEDRIVKRFLRSLAVGGCVEILTRRPLRPSAEEVAANPRARSARLRGARILAIPGES